MNSNDPAWMYTAEELLEMAEDEAAHLLHHTTMEAKMAYSEPYKEKEGDVSLFVNDKGDNPDRPDFTGYALMGPELKKMRLSLWAKESGKLRFSGQLQEPYEANNDPPF